MAACGRKKAAPAHKIGHTVERAYPGRKPWEVDPAAEFLGDDEDDLLAKPWN